MGFSDDFIYAEKVFANCYINSNKKTTYYNYGSHIYFMVYGLGDL